MKIQWATPLTTLSPSSLDSTYLEEVRILVLRGLLGSLTVGHLSSLSSLFRSLVRGVQVSQHEGVKRQGRDGVDLCVVSAPIAASHNGVFRCAASHTDGPRQMPPGAALTCLHVPHHSNFPSNTLHQVSEDGLKYRRVAGYTGNITVWIRLARSPHNPVYLLDRVCGHLSFYLV